MASAHRKLVVLVAKSHDVDRPARILLQGQGLHNDEILRVSGCLNVNKLVDSVSRLEQVRISIFAELAFEVSPE